MTKTLRQTLFCTGSAILVFSALAISAMTLYIVICNHWHGPFRDMWEIYPFLAKIIDGSWSLTDLWESYGYSHRLFLPKLLFIADHRWFSASNHLLIFVSILCQILICTLFAFLLWRDNSIPNVEKCALVAVVVCLQFSGTLLFNFMHTFDVQWFLCGFFIAAAFYQSSNVSSPNYHLLIGGLMIIAACLCSFSAMAAWPIWLLLVCIRLQNLKLKIIFLIVAVSFIALYSIGIRSAHVDVSGVPGFLQLLAYVFLVFPFSYLSNPLIDRDFLPFGSWAAIVVIPAIFVLVKFWWEFLRTNQPVSKSRLAFFLAAIATFAFGVAVITAVGRGYDPSHVRAMRYQNIVMLFWSAVILLAFLESRDDVVRSKFLLRWPLFAVFAGMVWCQTYSWSQNIWLAYQVNRAHLALMMGYSYDVPMIAPTVSRAMIYVPGYNLERERQVYEGAHKGIYSGDIASTWLSGVSALHIVTGSPGICEELSWSLLPYEGAYSRYTSFVVSGNTVGMRAAYLVNKNGEVLAIAIPSGTSNLAEALRLGLRLSSPLLKGFAAPAGSHRNSERPFALVLSRDSKSPFRCEVKPELAGPENRG